MRLSFSWDTETCHALFEPAESRIVREVAKQALEAVARFISLPAFLAYNVETGGMYPEDLPTLAQHPVDYTQLWTYARDCEMEDPKLTNANVLSRPYISKPEPSTPREYCRLALCDHAGGHREPVRRTLCKRFSPLFLKAGARLQPGVKRLEDHTYGMIVSGWGSVFQVGSGRRVQMLDATSTS